MTDWLSNGRKCLQCLMNCEKIGGRINVKMLTKYTLTIFLLFGITVSILLGVYPNCTKLFYSPSSLGNLAGTSTWKAPASIKPTKGVLDPSNLFHETAVKPVKQKRSEQSPGNI